MAEPVLRKDAARNRDRLLQAGREVFALRGLDATLNDIARHAKVGIGTAYRRFANKEELLEAIRGQQDDELEIIARDALEIESAWGGLVHFLERSLELHIADRAMAQILAGRHVSPARFDESRDRLAHLVNRIAGRAREAGELRGDVTGTDLILLQIACLSVAQTISDGPSIEGRDDLHELYRRTLGIMLDGLRPARVDTAPLDVPALTTDELHALLRRKNAPS